jgi:hypothetical protein
VLSIWLLMVSEKVLHFQGKNKDLRQLAEQIVEQLQSEGYRVQFSSPPLGVIIQAQKAGILRGIITPDRTFTLMIAGQPNDFTIRVGIEKCVQNTAVVLAEALFLSVLFYGQEHHHRSMDSPEILWTRHVEGEIIKKVTQIVGW